MATLTVIKPGMTTTNLGSGTAVAAGGDVCPNDGKTILRFTQTGSQTIVTVTAQQTSAQGWNSYNTKTITVPATTGDVVMGPFPKAIYDDTQGRLVLTYDSATTMKVWPISCGGE